MNPAPGMNSSAPLTPPEAVWASKTSWPSARLCLALLFLYFAANCLTRSLVTPSVEVDEAEQLILTQHLSWGYGPQPPLYTWLQRAFFQLLGTSVFALAAFKSVVLAGTALATYWSARRIAASHAAGLVAAALLLFSPEIAWESQRDRTHNVLAAMLAILTLWVFLQLREKRSAASYAGLGVCIGLGLLAKYNYALFLASLLVAASSIRSWRTILWHRGLWLAGAIAALLVAPHAWWAVHHPSLLFASTYKLHAAQPSSWAADLLHNMMGMLDAVFRLFGPALGVALVLWVLNRRVPTRPSPHPDAERLLLRQLLLAMLLILAAMIPFQVTSFKARWFQPILVGFPVLLGLALARKITPRAGRVFLVGVVVAALCLMVVLPGRFWLRGLGGKATRPCAPFRALASQMQPMISQASLLAASHHWIGGNLRLAVPEKQVVVPYLSGGPVTATNCLLVWEAPEGRPPPDGLLEFARTLGFAPLPGQVGTYFEAPYKFCPQQTMTLGAMVVTASQGRRGDLPTEPSPPK